MPHSISKPAAGGGFRLSDHVGDLVVFVGCKLEADVQTSFGPSNAARVQLVVPLDGEEAGEVFYDSLIFGKVIVPSLTNADGDIVVGRVGQGASKPGQNPAFLLTDASEEEEAAVLEWLESNIAEAAGTYTVIDGGEAE